jgi:hypothetical protein
MRLVPLLALCLSVAAFAGCGGSDTTTFVASPSPSISQVSPNSGPESGGTMVTLTGLNFGGANLSVTFGGGAATNVMAVNATTITCVSPAGSGVVQIAVTTDAGVGTAPFTYGGATAPQVSSISPGQGLETGGFPVTITGQNFVQGSTQVTFGAAAATSVTVADSFTLQCVAPAGTGTVNVSASTPQGTSVLTLTFTYVAVPTADIDLIVGSREGDAILVFEDIVNHSGLGADRVFSSVGSSIDNGGRMDFENDTLVVANRDNGSILVFRNFSTLADESAPDASVFVNRPNGIALVGGDLYVGSNNGNNVQIFRDVGTLASGDPPDLILSVPGTASFNCPADLIVVNDTLYVADRCSDRIYVWNGAAALAANVGADVELTHDSPRRIRIADNVLWVASSDNTSLTGYAPANALTTGQGPTTAVFGFFNLATRSDFDFAGTSILFGNRNDVDDVILTRVDVGLSTIFPQAEVLASDTGFDSIYDVRVAAGLLIVTNRNDDLVAWFAGAATLSSGRAPDGYLFDPRLSSTKTVIPIVNP